MRLCAACCILCARLSLPVASCRRAALTAAPLGVRPAQVFLHKQQRIQRELPHIFDKVLGLMRTADSWGLLSAAGPGVEVRVCEYHDYRPGGALNDNYHSDVGSLITSR